MIIMNYCENCGIEITDREYIKATYMNDVSFYHYDRGCSRIIPKYCKTELVENPNFVHLIPANQKPKPKRTPVGTNWWNWKEVIKKSKIP